MGELEARQYDQPHPIDEREQEGDPAEGDGDEGGKTFDDGGSPLASFRNAGEDCRDYVEEHDNDSSPSVDGVPQRTAPQADCRGKNYDDCGCGGRSALKNKGHNRGVEH